MKNNWIKVEDKLPPAYESVLCCCRGHFNKYFYIVTYIDKDNYWDPQGLDTLDVIAWRKISKFEDESIEVK